MYSPSENISLTEQADLTIIFLRRMAGGRMARPRNAVGIPVEKRLNRDDSPQCIDVASAHAGNDASRQGRIAK